MTAARVSELTGIKQRQTERYLQVGRGLRPGEVERLLASYPHAPLEMLIELTKWLEGPAGQGLEPAMRQEVLQKVAERRPTAAALPRLLHAYAVKKKPGRPPAAKFSYGRTREGGFDVTIRIPPHRLGGQALREAEQNLSAALDEVRRLLESDSADAAGAGQNS